MGSPKYFRPAPIDTLLRMMQHSIMHTSIKGFRIATGESLSQVARRFNVNKSTVLRWERNRVPAERVPEVGHKLRIPRYYLRPDLWPR